MGVLEPARRGRFVVLALIGLGVVLGALAARLRVVPDREPREGARGIPGESERVTVEVLNTTEVVGLARSVTRRLRDAGLDVVYYGSASGDLIDTTEVLVRRGEVERGERVARALRAGVVRAAPDASRLVDVTVRVGRDLAGGSASGRDP
jgi:hypothetical protein